MYSKLLAFVVACLVLSLVVLSFGFLADTPTEVPDFYVGISVAYADLPAIKTLIDKVSSYTNFYVIGSTGISENETKLIENC